MSYCVLADVQALIVNMTIDANSNPSGTQVSTEIIPQYDRYIDDRLGRYYITPITGANALLTMNRIEKYLVAAEVAERIYVGESPSDSPQSMTWRKMAEDDLTRLINGGIILTDAQTTSETPEPASDQIGDKLSLPTRQTPPMFSMGMKF